MSAVTVKPVVTCAPRVICARQRPKFQKRFRHFIPPSSEKSYVFNTGFGSSS